MVYGGEMVTIVENVGALHIGCELGGAKLPLEGPILLVLMVQVQDTQGALVIEEVDIVCDGHEGRAAREAQAALLHTLLE